MEAVVERSKMQVTEFCYFQRKAQKTGSEDLVSDISTCALDVSKMILTAEARILMQVSPCGICSG